MYCKLAVKIVKEVTAQRLSEESAMSLCWAYYQQLSYVSLWENCSYLGDIFPYQSKRRRESNLLLL